MLFIPKIAALGALTLAAVTTAAPSPAPVSTSSNEVVARGEPKVYDYDGDFKDIKVELVVVEVDKKGQSTLLRRTRLDPTVAPSREDDDESDALSASFVHFSVRRLCLHSD